MVFAQTAERRVQKVGNPVAVDKKEQTQKPRTPEEAVALQELGKLALTCLDEFLRRSKNLKENVKFSDTEAKNLASAIANYLLDNLRKTKIEEDGVIRLPQREIENPFVDKMAEILEGHGDDSVTLSAELFYFLMMTEKERPLLRPTLAILEELRLQELRKLE